jgi:ribosomal protein S18 acetylase RimI-like enzyme
MTITYREGNDVSIDSVMLLRSRVEFGSRSRADVEGQIAGARWVVTAWDGDRLVGFARAISDGVTNAYVSSVMVDPDYQRRGIGRGLMQRLVEGRDRIRFVLHSRKEAADFYRAIGFEDAPDILWRDRR